MTEKEWLNNNDLALSIYNKKYRYEDESFDEFLNRVSNGDDDIKSLILEKKFIFGGRILSGRGIKRKVTLSNCYVIEPPEDNLESIFECCKKLARTYSYGGGCGTDLSNLRPKGAEVNNAAKTTCGPVGFMELFSQTTATIGQSGRRGALMLSLDIRHPDIEEFIDCKTDLSKVNYANISVKMTDDFMKAVENDTDYELTWPVIYGGINTKCSAGYKLNELHYVDDIYVKRVKARDIFNKLVKNNWDYAEPGILYWNHIEDYNIVNNDPDFEYAGTNPCAEEPLPAGGSCLLGSINLSEFVKYPFTKQAVFDYENLEKTVKASVKALNDVLDEGILLHPLQEQQDAVSYWRQIGLGTMGLADCLIKLGVKYGSKESLKIIDTIYSTIAVTSVLASNKLAEEKGTYTACKKELLTKSSFIKALGLPEKDLNSIEKFGLHNSQLLTCAPTGSIGTMFETSTGVEPIFALNYTRKTLSLDGKESFYTVNTKLVDDYIKTTGKSELPDYFVTSADIKPVDRVKVQSCLQKYTDASISSTVNLPKEATVEDVYNIYMEAWRNNLKGITVYRSGCKREGILVTEKPKNIPNTSAPKRPKELEADFYTANSKGSQYIVLVGLYEGRPYEIFAFKPNIEIKAPQHKGIITKKSKMHYSFKSDLLQITELELANDNIEEKAATLYASMLLRHGVDIKYIIKTAKKVNDNIVSFSSVLCRILAKYMKTEISGKCPDCGSDLIHEGGCTHCSSCSYSKCE